MIHYLQLLNTQQEKDRFILLYQKYFQALYSAAFEILKDHAASEDIVHETFLILIDNINKVDEQNPMKTWNYLVTIVRHLCIDSLRKQKKTILYDMGTDNNWMIANDDIEAAFIGKEASELVKHLIQQMDYPYRQVLLLQYYNKMKSKDIAQTLNLKPDNVRQIAKRARAQLKKLLKERGYI